MNKGFSNIKSRKSSVAAKLQKGMRLRKYRLAACLGKGGSSEVWKARDCVEGIWVALKIPLIETNGQRDNKTLLNEIKMVSSLRHKHIMPVKNADIIDGHIVLATQISAGTLDDRSRPMSPKKTIWIISQVLDGLDHAHRRKLVHCDVTPGNIFMLTDGQAALGDFGISRLQKGRIVTCDVFGTPGYVAPEQAYGKPSYRSDCFAVALILYEFITGFLPRWPFRWPIRGNKRLKEKTNVEFVRFMKKALAIDPADRFANAGEMLRAMNLATPKKLQTVTGSENIPKRIDWKKARRNSFEAKYGKSISAFFNCADCGEPIAESMLICPNCGTDRNKFDERSAFDYICQDCHRGVLPEWNYCPWCYNAGFCSPAKTKTPGVRYQGKCKHCSGKLMRFMRYCPWCHRKVQKPWKVSAFPEICANCSQPVDTEFWNFCPWCTQKLI